MWRENPERRDAHGDAPFRIHNGSGAHLHRLPTGRDLDSESLSRQGSAQEVLDPLGILVLPISKEDVADQRSLVGPIEFARSVDERIP